LNEGQSEQFKRWTGDRFVTTHWTQVVASRADSEEGQQALSDLCATYYAPVVAFLCSQGRPEDEAREVAHEFFAAVLAHRTLGGADPNRGRFRSYLLGALKHFVANRRAKEHREKRGAGTIHQPLASENESELRLVDDSLAMPDMNFDRQWAMTVLEHGLAALKHESVEAGKATEFDVMKSWLTGEPEGKVGEAAQRLGMTEGAFRVATHRLRRRFRELVRTEIARTVEDPKDVAGEMNYLLTMFC
jgi:RNA polymerase sigma-70 factor (ECF subfamily)